MTLQVEFWTVVSFLLTFMGFVEGSPNGCSVNRRTPGGTIRLP